MNQLQTRLGSLLTGVAVTMALVSCSDAGMDCWSSATCGADASGGAAAGGKKGASGGLGGGFTEGGTGGSIAGGGAGGAAVGGEGGSGGTTGTSEANGGAGELGGAGGATPCNPQLSPAKDSCVISEKNGIFVSPAGNDSGDGTIQAPLRSITRAIEVALTKSLLGGPRVYACGSTGEFAETLTLTSAANGLALFGGFDCSTWEYSTETRAVINSAAPTAVTLNGLQGLTIENFDIRSANAKIPSGSSVALFAKASEGVKLTRVILTAGNGADGIDGVPPEPFNYPVIPDAIEGGTPTVWGKGCLDLEMDILCPTLGTTQHPVGKGGNGGDPLATDLQKREGQAGRPEALDGIYIAGGEGGTLADCEPPTAKGGQPGGTSTFDNHGAGAKVLGSLTENGWWPADGADGREGTPGQGGGGGASLAPNGTRKSVSGGGGGGCGGCGGAPAKGAKGGGGSIALLSLNSSISLISCGLRTGNGGNGGKGMLGQRGQPGSYGGGSTLGTLGCNGGDGGSGQDGGASGGGSGGISIGIVFKGTQPTKDSGTIQSEGKPGAGGPALVSPRSVTLTTTAGVTGQAADMWAAP